MKQQEQSCFQREDDPGSELTISAQLLGPEAGDCRRSYQQLSGKGKVMRKGRAPRPVFKSCSWTYGQRVWVEAPGDAGQDD